MGASSWKYFVPYKKDIAEALKELQEEVFIQGKYDKFTGYFRSFLNKGLNPPNAGVEETKELVEKWHAESGPKTIADLLYLNGEEGTSSILDMNGTSNTPNFGIVAPLSNQQLLELFNTDKPSRDLVETKEIEILSLRSSWQGIYIITYEDEGPSEICFMGFSGD